MAAVIATDTSGVASVYASGELFTNYFPYFPCRYFNNVAAPVNNLVF